MRIQLLIAVLGGATAAALHGQNLDDIREQLRSRQEAEVRAAGEQCVEADTAEAAALLLDTLAQTERRTRQHLPAAHFRDVVWESLIRLKSNYARQRVEHELETDQDNALVRQWCVELLGSYGDPALGRSVVRATRDRDAGVRRWAARSLGRLRYEPGVRELARMKFDRDRYIRANAIEALARIDVEEYGPTLITAIGKDRDAGVRCALLGAVPDLLPDRVEELSQRALRDKDWRPRMQAIDNLGEVRSKTAVDSLIAALPDRRPVVAARCMTALQRLTGEPISQPEVWPKWWADHRETFVFPAGKGERVVPDPNRTVTYNGIQLVSDHVAFLIDTSYQMKARLTSKNTTKAAAAAAEFGHVLDRMVGRLEFNVYRYHETVTPLAKRRSLKVTAKTKRRAREFVDAPPDGVAKDIWQALEHVITTTDLDTIYLLSSGEPDVGTYVHANRVTRHLRDLNRFHKVTVHTIAYSEVRGYRSQLRAIAEATGGRFEAFQ